MEHSLHLTAKHFVQAITPASSDSEGASDSDNNDDDDDNQRLDSGDSLAKVVLLGLSRCFLLIFKYCTNKSENLHGGRSHQKVVRVSAKLKNPISRF